MDLMTGYKRLSVYLTALLLCALLTACAGKAETIVITEEAGAEASVEACETADTQEVQQEAPVVYVHVCGAVALEGVYGLSEGERICDAVRAAGGMTEEADTTAINLATLLQDGMMIRIPVKGEAGEQAAVCAGGVVTPEVTLNTGLVNINTASLQELTVLKGIGEAYAQAIISFRESCGGFSTIEDIKKVKGIGEKTFESIKGQITV